MGSFASRNIWYIFVFFFCIKKYHHSCATDFNVCFWFYLFFSLDWSILVNVSFAFICFAVLLLLLLFLKLRLIYLIRFSFEKFDSSGFSSFPRFSISSSIFFFCLFFVIFFYYNMPNFLLLLLFLLLFILMQMLSPFFFI